MFTSSKLDEDGLASEKRDWPKSELRTTSASRLFTISTIPFSYVTLVSRARRIRAVVYAWKRIGGRSQRKSGTKSRLTLFPQNRLYHLIAHIPLLEIEVCLPGSRNKVLLGTPYRPR